MGAGQAILVIENTLELNTATSDLLECLGYRPARAKSVNDAVNNYINVKPDAVLIDASELGEEDILQLRSLLDNDPGAKIVALTESSGKQFEQSGNGLNGLVKGFLVKPLDISEISKLLTEVLA